MIVWASPDCGATQITVAIGSPSDDPDLEGNNGLVDPDKHIVWINRESVPVAAYPSVRFHEEMHHSGEISGSRYALQEYTKLDDAGITKLEELFIRTYGQAMFAYLMANGYLKYEPLSSGG